ncbi:iron complex transport system ATP-binding protein [Haloechinothrix alba]|uniref:Iron complex transport system ATP-binding protein n=1 Tax=Haloechinothrix alba TaxID=664784 RepID=A0A238Y2J7_9PSEU|nr:ABC transporter ATP-binding protein [Haloechinothrix alba]SNR65192.1 iron complex transport system ATP-binding protein [Haloechinothrix alba]
MTVGDVRVATDKLAAGYGKSRVVDDVDLTLPAGEVTVLVGPNGCGKSTLLRTVAGLLPALDGAVHVDGAPLHSLSRRALSQRLAFLPQASHVPAGVTVRELVRHGRYAHRGAFARHTDEDRESIRWALSVTDAEPLADKCLDELSGGERQRAWLATVLAQRTRILLLDEPTTYLDLRHQFDVLDVVRRLAREYHIACGVVLHDLMHAAAYGDRLVVIAEGAVLRSGPPEEVLASDAIERAFGLSVSVVRDPGTGYLTCFPQRPPVAL